jgi:hypothetical protein
MGLGMAECPTRREPEPGDCGRSRWESGAHGRVAEGVLHQIRHELRDAGGVAGGDGAGDLQGGGPPAVLDVGAEGLADLGCGFRQVEADAIVSKVPPLDVRELQQGVESPQEVADNPQMKTLCRSCACLVRENTSN